MHIISNCFECDDLSHIVVIFFDNSKGIVRENYSLFRLVGNHSELLFLLIYYSTIINVYIYVSVCLSLLSPMSVSSIFLCFVVIYPLIVSYLFVFLKNVFIYLCFYW